MAILTMSRNKLRLNYAFLQQLFETSEADWGVVTKLLCGNELFIKEVLALGIKEVHVSLVSKLGRLKKLEPKVQTCYI